MRMTASTKTKTTHGSVGRTCKFTRPSQKQHKTRTVPAGPAIAPVLISRVPVFEPTFRRSARSAQTTVWTTAWGTVSVQGRLTEMHRKILDAIFGYRLNAHRLETGAQAFLIDPYTVENAARGAHNPGWLRGMLQDMIASRVTIDSNTGMHDDGTIISVFWK